MPQQDEEVAQPEASLDTESDQETVESSDQPASPSTEADIAELSNDDLLPETEEQTIQDVE